MAWYIDADAYIKYCDEHWIPLNVDAVNAQPTADVVEVVHGEWVFNQFGEPHCSACGNYPLQNGDESYALSKYCPNCGARMDERRENDSKRSK